MTRLKLKRADFWTYMALVFLLGILCGVILAMARFGLFCFSSPFLRSQVPPDVLESGFIESISNPADSMFIGVGSPPQPAPTFTENLAQGGWASKPTENGALERARPPTLIITAYCPKSCCCGEFADGITASGHKIQPGDRFVAAPPEIPFGTMVTIPGYGRVKVEDRGSAIKGNRLDVFFGGKKGHEKALAWGVQTFEVGD